MKWQNYSFYPKNATFFLNYCGFSFRSIMLEAKVSALWTREQRLWETKGRFPGQVGLSVHKA